MSDSLDVPSRRRLIKSPQDFYGALCTLVLALTAWFLAMPLSSATGFRMGSGTAPRLFAGFLAAASLLVLVRSLLHEGPAISRPGLRAPLMMLGSVVIFALGIRPLGFVLTAILSTFVASFASADARPLEALGFAAGLTLFCCLLFVYAIKLPLPLWPAW